MLKTFYPRFWGWAPVYRGSRPAISTACPYIILHGLSQRWTLIISLILIATATGLWTVVEFCIPFLCLSKGILNFWTSYCQSDKERLKGEECSETRGCATSYELKTLGAASDLCRWCEIFEVIPFFSVSIQPFSIMFLWHPCAIFSFCTRLYS